MVNLEIYNKYNKYIKNLDCEEFTAIHDKMTSDFENNFVGTKKQLAEQESLLEVRIQNAIKKAIPEINKKKTKLNDDMLEEIRKGMCKPFCCNPKAFAILWNKAYEDGHSNGFYEVLLCLADLEEMYSDIEATKL